MKNRLFVDHAIIKVEEVSGMVNELFQENFQYFDMMDCIKKWNSFPIILLENKQTQKAFLEVVFYIDELDFDKYEKISYITTLAAMVEFGKIDFLKMEKGDILLLVSYLDSITFDKMKEVLSLLNRPELLFAVRKKSLDLKERMYILRYIDDLALEYIQNVEDEGQQRMFVQQMIAFLQKIDYYQLLEVSGYTAYREVRNETEE